MPLILIIEDHAALARLYQTVLERTGYRVALAADGEAGIEAARQEHPDLVILDLLLPGMSGTQVARLLYQEGILPNTPLIITSGLGAEETDRIGESLNASAVLVKPFDLSTMQAAIREALDSPKPEAGQEERVDRN